MFEHCTEREIPCDSGRNINDRPEGCVRARITSGNRRSCSNAGNQDDRMTENKWVRTQPLKCGAIRKLYSIEIISGVA